MINDGVLSSPERDHRYVHHFYNNHNTKVMHCSYVSFSPRPPAHSPPHSPPVPGSRYMEVCAPLGSPCRGAGPTAEGHFFPTRTRLTVTAAELNRYRIPRRPGRPSPGVSRCCLLGGAAAAKQLGMRTARA